MSRRQLTAVLLALGLHLGQLQKARGENHVDYRYESYKEENGRISIDTHSAHFATKPLSWLEIKGEVVYDAISGATPTGAPPATQLQVIDVFTGQLIRNGLSRSVPVVAMEDTRYAGGIQPTVSLGRHHFTPGFAYSEESDYISYGGSFNYALDLNEKNTTLNLGWSHNADEIAHGDNWEAKNTDDFMVGINQLLGPKTVLTVNFTYGKARGYLADPYKGMYFEGYTVYYDPSSPSTFVPPTSEEKRPGSREKYIGYASLTHFVTPLNGSVEASYRYYQDTYGINSHTLGLAWYQKIGQRVTVSPSFRFAHQSAADFYYVRLPGLPSDPTTPSAYSADYRLSALESFTYGINVTVRATDWLWFDAGYKRYEMVGLDNKTSASAYPSANIFTVGARLFF